MQWQKPLAAFVFVWVIGFPALPPASAQSAKPKASAVSFAGKTVTILIPYSVGGSADIMARMMVPYMPGVGGSSERIGSITLGRRMGP
jgi:hypothetical protein